MRATDTFAGFTFEEVRIGRAEHQLTGVLVYRIVYVDTSQVRHSQQTGDIRVVHEYVIVETVCFKRIHFAEFRMLYNSIFLDSSSHFVSQ